MNIACRRYRRAEAVFYLREKWGVPCTYGSLSQYAVKGGGPRYQLMGRIPLYPESELDAWAQARLSPLKSSTSDSAEVA